MDFELLPLPSSHGDFAAAPLEDPPAASASYQDRAAWSARYVAWFIDQTGEERGFAPADVSPTHRYEVEFNYCMLDPQRYLRETQEELKPKTVH